MAWERDERRGWREDRWDDGDRGYGRRQGWSADEDGRGRGRGRGERGFFERASDEVASWFGDEEAERRRRRDERMDERDYGAHYSRDRDGDRDRWPSGRQDRDRERAQGWSSGRHDYDRERDYGGGYGESGWTGASRDDRGRQPSDDCPGGYRPVAGDYGRGSEDRGDYGRQSQRERDSYRRTGFAGSAARSDRDDDPHYRQWRRQRMDELDQDYDEYRRERQSHFENDFGSWRERRQSKRQLLGRIREHMEVVGRDDRHVGTVDKVAGDRLILTKSDPDSGGAHHSLSCTDIDRVEGDKVILELSADQARQRWRDDDHGRALFERDDQGEAGPHILDRSFSGTYR